MPQTTPATLLLQPFPDALLEDAFTGYPAATRLRLLELRTLIYHTARSTPGVGDISESVKWGAPSYAPVRPRTGTPLRLDTPRDDENTVGLYVHCQSQVMSEFLLVHHGSVRTDGTRALLLPVDEPIPSEAVVDFITLALTYRLRRRG